MVTRFVSCIKLREKYYRDCFGFLATCGLILIQVLITLDVLWGRANSDN
jgi:hypothetical protein